MTFQLGRANAIVGPSGSGKSTVAYMLERLYDPDSGRIMIGNRDIRNLNVN
jgi:ABC-type multidrug transport system fused ATPase/permease subunit